MSGPVPARVDGAAKAVLLDVIDRAVSAGWSLSRICGVLELDRQRAWRWQRRRRHGRLDDQAPGGNPIHGILAWEEAAVLELFEQWGARIVHRDAQHTPDTAPHAAEGTPYDPSQMTPEGQGARQNTW